MELFSLTFHRDLHDLNPIAAGIRKCSPGEICEIDDLSHTQICHVTDGKGTYYIGGQLLDVCAGQAFIVPPHKPTRHIADSIEPWTYEWVAFDGMLSQQFSQLPPVFSPEGSVFPHLRLLQDGSPNPEIQLMMDLMLLYAAMVSPEIKKRNSRNYIQEITDYIGSYYMRDLTIQEIADHIGLNRDYISKIFKAEQGRSIQSYLMNLRMQHAKNYLQLGYSVNEAGSLCGFNSSAHFSRQFKHFFGESPQQWAKKTKQNL